MSRDNELEERIQELESRVAKIESKRQWGEVYCLHCKNLLIEFFRANRLAGSRTCPICGALNHYDSANPQDQKCELPPGHSCSACDGTSDTLALPASPIAHGSSMESSDK